MNDLTTDAPLPAQPDASSGTRWYLVNAQTGREALAVQHLTRQGYRPFLPTMRKTVRHARRIRDVSAAYFPGYLFVALDLATHRWRPIDSTVGVLRLVKAGERPLPAPPGLVEALIDATDDEGILTLSQALKPGDQVRIVQGPFADRLAVVDSLRGEDRVRVLLDLMRQFTPVDLGRGDLRPA
jgi:transcriptional antiterminator RfaH